MPELPEVECVRRSIERRVVGRRVVAVELRRADILQPAGGMRRGTAPVVTTRGGAGETCTRLLRGQAVIRAERHGKRLAIVAKDGSAVGVHLGMSGRLLVFDPETGAGDEPFSGVHTHAVWRLDDGSRLAFVDHRRFGGLWDWSASDGPQAWFAGMGPDALAIGPVTLWRGLGGTRRGLKAALLDQQVVAGLGNIYADELLFNARLHPLTPANRISQERAAGLVRRVRTLLNRAIAAGGSTLRDYRDGDGASGGYQLRHRVYGRAGLPCGRRSCPGRVTSATVAGRTTAWCPVCQPEKRH
ncbi:MAG: bifunctional DNA-formamidopyrimidine glycosylase/DNA-(apurinic or apyrimidinic site) lyase [Planctomycetota bacterium]